MGKIQENDARLQQLVSMARIGWWEVDFDVEVNVPGKFSVYNSLTAIAICHHFGVSVEEIKKAMLHVSVKGRIEIVPVTKRYTLIVYDQDKRLYYECLEKYDAEETIAPLTEFLKYETEKTWEKTLERGERENRKKRLEEIR